MPRETQNRWSKAHIWLSATLIAVIGLRAVLHYDLLDPVLGRYRDRMDDLTELVLIPLSGVICILAILAWRRRFIVEQEAHRRIETEEALHRQQAYVAAMHEISLALMNRSDLTDVLATIVTRAGTVRHAAWVHRPPAGGRDSAPRRGRHRGLRG
jgi:hypothetical protein